MQDPFQDGGANQSPAHVDSSPSQRAPPQHNRLNSLANSEWLLKEISWPPDGESRNIKIITQNKNGPCSFIAVCNILILRGDIQIQPLDRRSASYEYLSSLVGDYLLSVSNGSDIAAALSILPTTQEGMDLNPLFTGISSFRPSGDGGALQLFKMANIKLVHGWLVDPDSREYSSVAHSEDYDTSINSLVEADDITNGQFTNAGEEIDAKIIENNDWTQGQREKIERALLIRRWLDSNSSQLTYYGLFTLSSILEPGELVALFRSSHLSVLYRRKVGDSSTLYTLVSEYSFSKESSVVWESLLDVDGQMSEFYDSHFFKASPAGGDFVGRTAESTLRALEEMHLDDATRADQALARQLQEEEDLVAVQQYEQRRAEHVAAARARQHTVAQSQAQAQIFRPPPDTRHENPTSSGPKKKSDCIIM